MILGECESFFPGVREGYGLTVYFVMYFVFCTATVDGLIFLRSKECLRTVYSAYKVEAFILVQL